MWRARVARSVAAVCLLSASLAGAQTQASASRDDTPILLLSFLVAGDRRVGSVVAESVRVSLRRMVPPRDLHVVSRATLDRVLQTEDPGRWSVADVREVGRMLRADVVLEIDATKSTSGVRLTPVLLRTRGDSEPRLVGVINAGSIGEAARALAKRIATDSSLGIRRLCPTKVLFEFQVTRSAQYIDDSLAVIRPAKRGETGPWIVSFIVDTAGRADTATLKALKPKVILTLDQIRDAASRWRFVPARVGNCVVREELQIPIKR